MSCKKEKKLDSVEREKKRDLTNSGEKVREQKKGRKKKENNKGKKTQLSFYTKECKIKSDFYTNQFMFVLLYKEVQFSTNKLDSSISSVVISLLQEFEDAFPKEIPICLPLIREIKHQINPIPGAIIHN